MRRSVKTCSIVLAMVSTMSLLAEGKNWPTIQQTEGKQTYLRPGKEGTDTPFLLLLKSTEGVPLYKLECHNGNYEDSSEINFSGDFQCVLFAIKDDTRTSWNLLATGESTEQETDWLNRGRMTANQLWGQCGTFTEFGRIRHFKLRGILLTFEFTDLRWSPIANRRQPQLEKFTFKVSAVPDKSAQSAIAESVDVSAPPSSCK